MSGETMVARVARAIALDRAEPFDDMRPEEQASWMETAHAAIDAMRGPNTVTPVNRITTWGSNVRPADVDAALQAGEEG